MRHLTISLLSNSDLPQLHQTFLKSFEDYLIPIQLSANQFKVKIKREGIVADFCVGAFDGSTMVGFIMTGLGEWQGKPTAFNGGTGVVKAYRGQHLTQRMYEVLLSKLKSSGVDVCLLEVIQENMSALKNYRQIGFSTIRNLDCYRVSKNELSFPPEPIEDVIIKAAIKPNWSIYTTFWEVQPSWQNNCAALKRIKEEIVVLEAFIDNSTLGGYIAYSPKTGGVAQLAVHPQYRNSGIATALLKEVAKRCEAPAIMFINVDSESDRAKQFLYNRNFKKFLSQYEMYMKI